MTATGTDAVANPNRFASAYLDPTGLYKMGARYYNPATGDFTQQDDVSHTGDLTQGNRFAYAGDDPIENLDPTGADLFSDVLDVGSTVASGVGDVLDATVVGSPVGAAFDALSIGLAGGAAAESCAYGSTSDCEQSDALFGIALGTAGTGTVLGRLGYEGAAAGVSGAGLGFDVGHYFN